MIGVVFRSGNDELVTRENESFSTEAIDALEFSHAREEVTGKIRARPFADLAQGRGVAVGEEPTDKQGLECKIPTEDRKCAPEDTSQPQLKGNEHYWTWMTLWHSWPSTQCQCKTLAWMPWASLMRKLTPCCCWTLLTGKIRKEINVSPRMKHML